MNMIIKIKELLSYERKGIQDEIDSLQEKLNRLNSNGDEKTIDEAIKWAKKEMPFALDAKASFIIDADGHTIVHMETENIDFYDIINIDTAMISMNTSVMMAVKKINYPETKIVVRFSYISSIPDDERELLVAIGKIETITEKRTVSMC